MTYVEGFLTPVPTATNAANRVIVPGRDRDESGFLARTRLSIDTRTQTAYGTLRAFLQYQIDRVQGLYGEGGLASGANTITNGGGNNATLRRGDEIETITPARAAELLAEKRAKGPAPKKRAPAKKAPAKKAVAKKTTSNGTRPAKKAAAKTPANAR